MLLQHLGPVLDNLTLLFITAEVNQPVPDSRLPMGVKHDSVELGKHIMTDDSAAVIGTQRTKLDTFNDERLAGRTRTSHDRGLSCDGLPLASPGFA
jgi:hypothetical protein